MYGPELEPCESELVAQSGRLHVSKTNLFHLFTHLRVVWIVQLGGRLLARSSPVLLFKSLKFHNRLEKGLGCFSDIVVFAAFETVPADSRNLGRHVIPQKNELRSAAAGLHVSGPRPTALLCRFKHPCYGFQLDIHVIAMISPRVSGLH